jgi:dihydrofolate reductase
MGNGTIFTFVTEGIEVACEKAVRAAKGKDVRVGGGAQTVQQFLELGLLDELHVALVPVTLNSGEELFTDKALQLRRYRALAPVISDSVAHQTYVRN